MSDDDGASGIIGGLLSLVLLVVLWPYLLAALGLFIAYLLLAELFAWVSSHYTITALWVGGVIGIYLIFRWHLIGRSISKISGWVRRSQAEKQWTAVDVLIKQPEPDLVIRQFIPSTNLYCYWCTKKLGKQSWEKEGKYYCQHCYEKCLGLASQD